MDKKSICKFCVLLLHTSIYELTIQTASLILHVITLAGHGYKVSNIATTGSFQLLI
jgi:hypothetical protein